MPNNQIFVVVGDVKTQEVLDHVALQWAGTPRGRETFVPLPEEPEQVSPRESVREMDGTVYDIALAWPTVTLSNRDMYALDLAAYILGQGESSRLARQLKYESRVPLVLGVGALQQHAALRPRLLRRHRDEQSARPGETPKRKSSAWSTSSATRKSALPNWPRPRSRKRPNSSSSTRRSSSRPKA